jgi:hypothetical protein
MTFTPLTSIIIGALLGLLGVMAGVTLGVICLAVILLKRRNNHHPRAIIIPPPSDGVLRLNRYIQKTVSSPVYEPTDIPIPTKISLQPMPNNGSLASTSSSNSSRNDTAVYPEMATTSLSVPNRPVKDKSPLLVSPYERPVLLDESTLKSNHSNELMEEIIVPDEEQRSIINGSYEFDEMLYKTLYQVQQSKEAAGVASKKFFEESPEYWKPKTSTNAIYSQFASKRFREIPRPNLEYVALI